MVFVLIIWLQVCRNDEELLKKLCKQNKEINVYYGWNGEELQDIFC